VICRTAVWISPAIAPLMCASMHQDAMLAHHKKPLLSTAAWWKAAVDARRQLPRFEPCPGGVSGGGINPGWGPWLITSGGANTAGSEELNPA